METRITTLEVKMDLTYKSIDRLDHSIERMDHTIMDLRSDMDKKFLHVDQKFLAVDRKFCWVIGLQIGTLLAIVGFMAKLTRFYWHYANTLYC